MRKSLAGRIFRLIPTAAMLTLAVLALSLHLPRLYDQLAVKWIEKTHLFYSPVLKDFIYTEATVGFDPEAAARAEDHHAGVAYKDARGRYYDRLEFEGHLPFIYVRNMDRRGLLPLNIDGRELDRRTIEDHRQVLELSARNLPGRTPPQKVWPLLEARPDQAGLVFPDDRFRLTDRAMEFISADDNRVDRELTELWTGALLERGFKFPARLAAGNFTILKPFDDGVFLVDDQYAVFHLKRTRGRAEVVRTPIDPALKCRHLTVVENNQRRFHGLMLDGQNQIHLVTTDDYRLIPLPLPGYEADRMDLKIIFNPLHRTAVYSDQSLIRAVAFDLDYRPLAEFEHLMSRARPDPARQAAALLFPFRLVLESENSRLIEPGLILSPNAPVAFPVMALAGGLIYAAGLRLRRRRLRPAALAFVCAAGLYGLIAALVIIDE